MQRAFLTNLALVLMLNLLVKPFRSPAYTRQDD